MEKSQVLPLALGPSQTSPPPPRSKKPRFFSFPKLVLFAGLAWGLINTVKRFEGVTDYTSLFSDYSEVLPESLSLLFSKEDQLCPQYDVLVPQNPLWSTMGDMIETEEFKMRAVDWLGGAVRVPSESYDGMDPPGIDPRWETFALMHEYLAKAFPLVHSTLSLKKVNIYGLIYEWTGTDPSRKPALLAAHQDVVPVDPKTVDEWTHPPYSGYFDGSRIWGRGSNDDKSGLIGILSTIEVLLEKGFKPSRTFVLAFGFDEECSGTYGAQELGKVLLATYGKDSFAFVVDEGMGFYERYGTTFATPGIAEKGYLDTRVDIASPGGHSSVPPKHTTIGMLAKIIVAFEENPYPVKMDRDLVLYGTFQCYAGHGKSMPASLRKTVEKSLHSDTALSQLGSIILADPNLSSIVAPLMGTTQAVDLINGGVKTNALPEQAYAVINHRINTISSVEEVMKRDTETVKAFAEEFNLTLEAFGKSVIGDPAYGSVKLSSAFNRSLEPAPVTPMYGDDARAYEMLAGTIKATYNAHRGLGAFSTIHRTEELPGVGGETVVVAPGMSTGNTDTKYYWNLSRSIFRYNHKNMGKESVSKKWGVHTVNEYIDADAFLEIIRFFSTLILNADEATSL